MRHATIAAAAVCLLGITGCDEKPDEPPAFASSFFREPLSDHAQLDDGSAEMVAQLRNLALGVDPGTGFDCSRAVMKPPEDWSAAEAENCRQVTTRAGIAFDDFAPVVYTVPPDQATVPVVSDAADPDLTRIFAEGVPIPPGAQAAGGTDQQLIIWQPATDTMWEFWRAYQDASGAWHAGYGGRMEDVSQNPGHFHDVVDPERPGSFLERHNWGGPASSIPNLPGLMTVDQLRSGTIGHALVFATWTNKPGQWVYPAQRTDGTCRGEYCSDIPQGARFRLDPAYDVGQIEHPVVRMIAEAVQDYGMVLNNSTGGGLAFYAEGWRAHGWDDPYYGEDGLFANDPDQLQASLFMREFPWDRLQMLKRGTTCTDPAVECKQPENWP